MPGLTTLGGPAGVTFIRFTPPPPGTHRTGFVEERPGVEGYAVWQDAIRGPSFTAETFTDVVNTATAWQLQQIYAALVFRKALKLEWQTVEFNYYVVPTAVTFAPNAITGTIAKIGGFGAATYSATLKASWTFLVVPKIGDGLINTAAIIAELTP